MTTNAPITLVVTGGRSFADREIVFTALDAAVTTSTPCRRLYHGACGVKGRPGWKEGEWRRGLRGADGLADSWARDRGVPVQAWPAFWDLGTKAGPMRNGWMLGAAVTDAAASRSSLYVVAFPGDIGTADCVGQARRLGIEVIDLREDP